MKNYIKLPSFLILLSFLILPGCGNETVVAHSYGSEDFESQYSEYINNSDLLKIAQYDQEISREVLGSDFLQHKNSIGDILSQSGSYCNSLDNVSVQNNQYLNSYFTRACDKSIVKGKFKNENPSFYNLNIDVRAKIIKTVNEKLNPISAEEALALIESRQ